MSLQVRAEPYGSEAASALTARVQQEYVEMYGGPDRTPVDPMEFSAPTGGFLVGYLDGLAVAMGGVRRHESDAIEIKRMYVAPEVRGRGLSRLMLRALEDLGRALGARRVVLETGERQPEAMRLYETSGYQRIDGFGHYRCQPLSVSYGKSLIDVNALSG
ncbi:MAG TPA: GNAT family N-acetyltransferase [Mycobacteriales bacterium]|nr:GNAT family N-acetyltransferase [Mycobacteriales bacterium]